jgi:hypothetical protein
MQVLRTKGVEEIRNRPDEASGTYDKRKEYS